MITADLSGKRVLVTGGVSGIGKATVELFARCGATVAAGHLVGEQRATESFAQFSSAGIGNSVIPAPGDVSKRDDAERMVQRAIEDLGGLDYLVNNAGTPATDGKQVDYADLDFYTDEFWNRVISTNLYGPFYCTRAAAPALRASKGSIVAVSSIAGTSGGGSLAYSSSKAGINVMIKNLAGILAPDVRVNAVAPGMVDTPWTAGFAAERKERSSATLFIQRLIRPDEIAETILFLCAGPPMLNAQVVTVDGGRR